LANQGGCGTQRDEDGPTSIGLNVEVTVRTADEAIPHDGVWLNGQRSYDTYIMIDRDVRYQTPCESIAEGSFELHEAAGGGQIV
jgi:hypothetical protein